MMRNSSLCLLPLVLLIACATPAPVKPQAGPLDGHTKLAQAVRPTEYELELSIDPASEIFSGVTTIHVQVDAPETRAIQLHAEGLNIEQTSVITAQGAMIAAAAASGDNGALVVTLAQPLAPGAYRLVLRYKGALDEVPTGLYRVKEGDRWYVFTQFEPLEAREAFPCFDEPGFKTPFTFTIHTPADQRAFANTPETSSTVEGARRITRFLRSKPLPTYLVAFTVGELDVIEAPQDAIPGVPLRLIATKGKAEQGRWILNQTPAIMKALTDYFGMPYPYEKLDLVAVPNFSAGAMENVGLVTFRDGLLLVDPALATPQMRSSSLGVLAHELAHMWFGNLVTPAWWDDLWLNESFATWMADYVMVRVAPDLNPPSDRIEGLGWVINADSRAQTRAIRQPITRGGDVYNAFDGITYSKGALVLSMVESWLGEQIFRDAIRRYMQDNAHGQVTSAALFKALDATSDKPVSRVMSTFVDRPGAPLVSVERACDAQGARLILRQSRYLPKGSKAAPQADPWAIPMCLRITGEDGQTKRECLLFDTTEHKLATAGCAALVHPNDGERGYYHWQLDPELWSALLKGVGALGELERLGLLLHMDALVASGQLRHLNAWDATLALASAPDASVQLRERRLGMLVGMQEAARRLDMLPEWRAMLDRALKPELERLSLEPAPNEDPQLTNYRLAVIHALGHGARDPYVLASAQAVLANFLETPDAIPAGRLRWALGLAAEGGDVMLWERLAQIAFEAKSPAVRNAALQALGYFRDPMLQDRSLALILDERVRSNEFWSLYGPMMREPMLYTRAWGWFKASYPKIVDKLGEKAAPGLPGAGGGHCSPEGQADVEAFFRGLKEQPDGLERNLSQTLERIGVCDVQVKAELEDARRFLSGDAKR
jgi:alanyl aminopeptidase